MQSPHQHLARLFEWLGLPVDTLLINSAVDSYSMNNVRTSKKPFATIPKWNEAYPKAFFGPAPYNVDDIQLSHLQRLEVEYIAGDLLRELGYPEVKSQFSIWERIAISGRIRRRLRRFIRRFRRMWGGAGGHHRKEDNGLEVEQTVQSSGPNPAAQVVEEIKP